MHFSRLKFSNLAMNDESRGLQAYIPKLTVMLSVGGCSEWLILLHQFFLEANI